MSYSVEKTREMIKEVRWFHRIDVGHGIITPGVDDSGSKLGHLDLPEDLTRKSVLDIGALDGFFSFECERRGAARVVALDSFCWNGSTVWNKQGFNVAKELRSSQVEAVECDVMDISPERLGTFDLVLFLGVFYHLRHPFLALERIFSVTRDHLILETHVERFRGLRPAMTFYPGSELNDDPTNWWGPNCTAVMAMLKEAGYREIRVGWKSPAWRSVASGIKRVFVAGSAGRMEQASSRSRRTAFNSMRQGRMVFHASR